MRIKEKKFVRIGSCKRCGKCCQADHLLASCTGPEKMVLMALSGRATISSDLKGFKCKHVWFKKGKARCKIYSQRPDFCKAYPVVPADLVVGCGFSFKETVDEI